MKLLFLCSKTRLRSPTAEAIFAEYEGLEVDSAGLDREAETPVDSEAIEWADLIFVMEQSHRRKLTKNFQRWLKNKRVVCLDIPDNYQYMEFALVELYQFLKIRLQILKGVSAHQILRQIICSAVFRIWYYSRKRYCHY